MKIDEKLKQYLNKNYKIKVKKFIRDFSDKIIGYINNKNEAILFDDNLINELETIND